MIQVLEQLRHTYGKRVVLDTPNRLVTVDTGKEDFGPSGCGLGAIVTFEMAARVHTRIAEDDVESFHNARENAVKFISAELYGEIERRLHDVQLEIYQTNPQGCEKASQMINELMRDMRP